MTVLFICTGNTCRSPMAMALFRLKNTDIQAESAGIFAENGQPATSEAIAVCARLGADLSAHASRRLTHLIAENADIMITMTQAQKDQLLLARYPAEKIFTLSELTGIPGGIPDPYGLGEEAYRHTASMLSLHIEVLNQVLGGRL